jgi:hypothetical protein
MVRFLVLSCVLLFSAPASPALAQVKFINVSGQLSGGSFVAAVCSVSSSGQINGTGVLYGMNPGTGYTYKYPFAISKGSTASGKLVLTGTFAGVPGSVVTLSASVPSGSMTFIYVVNGTSTTLTGNGTVSAK